MVVNGELTVSRENGFTISLSAGDCFCETALVRKRVAKATVQSVTPATVLVLPRLKFQRLTRRFPKIGRLLHRQLLEHIGRKLDEATESP